MDRYITSFLFWKEVSKTQGHEVENDEDLKKMMWVDIYKINLALFYGM
jgi:hypothetical protein